MAEVMALTNGYVLELGENIPAEAAEKAKALYAKFKEDAAAQEILAKAQSVEDVYDAIVSYADCTLDEFRNLFDAVAHRAYDLEMEAAGPKEELTEEELDVVAGGGFWGWVKRNLSALGSIAAGVAVTVVGAATAVAGIVATATGIGAYPGIGAVIGGAALAGVGIGAIVDGVKRLN